MKPTTLKEFIDKGGALINSKMPPNINQFATSHSTTDQHVAASRQGMVWMNYRRFYGETDETLPYTKYADKWEKNPKKFYEYLKSKGKESDFNKYFVRDEEDVKEPKNTAAKVLKETQRNKMRELVEDLVTKKISGDLVKKPVLDNPTMNQLRTRETALFKEMDILIKKINEAFKDTNEKDTIADYITQKLL